MFSGRTFLFMASTPDDVSPDFPEALLTKLFNRSKGPNVQSAFNYSLPEVWAGTASLIDRGIPVLGVIDHVQWCGPSCQKMARDYLRRYENWWRRQYIAIGSTQIHHAIEHKKTIVFNAPILGYDVPDGDFETLDGALDAGYPVTWTGSLNFSVPGKDEANDVFIIPSKDIARATVEPILAQREMILRTQQLLQPFPKEVP